VEPQALESARPEAPGDLSDIASKSAALQAFIRESNQGNGLKIGSQNPHPNVAKSATLRIDWIRAKTRFGPGSLGLRIKDAGEKGVFA
jgi:hypothetical protein